jgi:hypothetical protein
VKCDFVLGTGSLCVFGRFETKALARDELIINVGDIVPKQQFIGDMRSLDNPLGAWWPGRVVNGSSVSTPSGACSCSFLFNHEKRGWHYGYSSHRFADEEHSFVAYFLQEKEYGKCTCISILRSDTFKFFSQRRSALTTQNVAVHSSRKKECAIISESYNQEKRFCASSAADPVEIARAGAPIFFGNPSDDDFLNLAFLEKLYSDPLLPGTKVSHTHTRESEKELAAASSDKRPKFNVGSAVIRSKPSSDSTQPPRVSPQSSKVQKQTPLPSCRVPTRSNTRAAAKAAAKIEDANAAHAALHAAVVPDKKVGKEMREAYQDIASILLRDDIQETKERNASIALQRSGHGKRGAKRLRVGHLAEEIVKAKADPVERTMEATSGYVSWTANSLAGTDPMSMGVEEAGNTRATRCA